jgi:DNA-binding NtrC family response regulator
MNLKIPEFTRTNIDAGFAPEDEDTRKLYREVAAFARQGQPIVIFGPTGSGKEFLARHYYNALAGTEFFEQTREQWPARFEELYKLYSAVYQDESLKAFVNSIRAGVFQTINSANIYPNLAESILFGHESGSFTDAVTRPGLLESIKYGVLFLDEIGELPRHIQAKLLRAVDSEISEGCRISGRMNYSLRDVIIISATNQPRDKIRNDFYYKLGIEVNIKGIDERPKDTLKSLPWFIGRAIGKRKDYATIINVFGISGLRDIGKIADTDQVKEFAQDLSIRIADRITARRWPGNFRALRTAIEASVFRIESPSDLKEFSARLLKNIDHYIERYSENISKSAVPARGAGSSPVFPTSDPDLDRRILEKLNSAGDLEDLSILEKKILNQFLSLTHEGGFIRKDLEEFYRKNEAIRHTSEAHIRNRINMLLCNGLLDKSGTGKNTRYSLCRSFTGSSAGSGESFSLPSVNPSWVSRQEEIDEMKKILNVSERIFIQAPAQSGKSDFIAMFCGQNQAGYSFYYYPLGEGGIEKLFSEIIRLLKQNNTYPQLPDNPEDPASDLKPYLDKVFKGRNGSKPVLIIDNAHLVSKPDSIQTMVDLTVKWKELILILVGDKMDNAFQDMFFEFSLRPWTRRL